MRTVSLPEAQSHLPQLIGSAAEGEDILIVGDDHSKARLTADRPSLRDIKPVSLGKVLRQLSNEDDLLDEMINT